MDGAISPESVNWQAAREAHQVGQPTEEYWRQCMVAQVYAEGHLGMTVLGAMAELYGDETTEERVLKAIISDDPNSRVDAA